MTGESTHTISIKRMVLDLMLLCEGVSQPGIFLENKFRGAIRVFQKLRGAELKLG